jgi:PH (Pleckstrin Homology) domain-containing protein
MGLFSSLLGNASEIDIAKVQAELEPVLAPGETIGRGFKIFRDMLIFTDHRLIMIDKEGLTGSKVSYHSVLYRSITQFSVETAGSFDTDTELKIWVSGAGTPITKEFKKGTDVVGIQKYLAYCAFGGSIKKD